MRLDPGLEHPGERAVRLQPEAPGKREALLPNVLAAAQELLGLLDAAVRPPDHVARDFGIRRIGLEHHGRLGASRRLHHEAIRFPAGGRLEHLAAARRPLFVLAAFPVGHLAHELVRLQRRRPLLIISVERSHVRSVPIRETRIGRRVGE